MAKTPEGAVKADVKKILEEYGVWFFMPATHGYGRSGVPDFICCFLGFLIAIETKAGDNELTALQKREIKRIKDAGGYALTINEANLSDLRQLLNEIQSDARHHHSRL